MKEPESEAISMKEPFIKLLKVHKIKICINIWNITFLCTYPSWCIALQIVVRLMSRIVIHTSTSQVFLSLKLEDNLYHSCLKNIVSSKVIEVFQYNYIFENAQETDI